MRRTHLCNHFHCDPIFTCPQSIHIAESVELAHQFVDIARTDPDFRCILSEIDYLQGYWNVFVEERADFERLLRESHIETSGSYSEPNENSVGGEALVRNIVYGQWFLLGRLGGHGKVYLPFDVFGHVIQLPQILRKSGFTGAIWTKGSPASGRQSLSVLVGFSGWIAYSESRCLVWRGRLGRGATSSMESSTWSARRALPRDIRNPTSSSAAPISSRPRGGSSAGQAS